MKRNLMMSIVVLAAAACAAPKVRDTRMSKSGGFVVGTSDKGKTVLAATHYDAMNGQAVAEDELGVQCADKSMECKRETLVGSHFPEWVCRCKAESDADRARTRDLYEQMTKTRPKKM